LPESSSSTAKLPERFASWGDRDEREVTHWIGRSYWGRGIATGTLKAFLTVDPSRPLHARVAFDNVASHRVREKCGFRVIANERSFAEARSGEIEEFVLRLEEAGPRARDGAILAPCGLPLSSPPDPCRRRRDPIHSVGRRQSPVVGECSLAGHADGPAIPVESVALSTRGRRTFQDRVST
jgi:hypothetical protein